MARFSKKESFTKPVYFRVTAEMDQDLRDLAVSEKVTIPEILRQLVAEELATESDFILSGNDAELSRLRDLVSRADILVDKLAGDRNYSRGDFIEDMRSLFGTDS